MSYKNRVRNNASEGSNPADSAYLGCHGKGLGFLKVRNEPLVEFYYIRLVS